ncbi:MAG TPA: hypothetical protein V6D22_15285 [Candidatus Obscuribacterales bacterium]
MHLLRLRIFFAVLFVCAFLSGGSALAGLGGGNGGMQQLMGPAIECRSQNNFQQKVQANQQWSGRQTQQANKSHDQTDVGGGLGAENTVNQAKQVMEGTSEEDLLDDRQTVSQPFKWKWKDHGTNEQAEGYQIPYEEVHNHSLPQIPSKLTGGSGVAGLFGGSYTYTAYTSSGTGGGGNLGGAGETYLGWMFPNTTSLRKSGIPAGPNRNANVALGGQMQAQTGHSFGSHPEHGRMSHETNASAAQGSRASSAGEDSKEQEQAAFDGYMEYLINVANEEAGAACSSHAVSKTYANVVWMVQQMYKQCYIPMAILLLLPGAIITQVKAFTYTGFMVQPVMPDPDLASPFIGIARAMVAVFLIPATQLAVSYCIDIGNSLEDVCQPYVSLPMIEMWCQEQIQTLDPNQQGNPIENIPQMPQAAYRGKFAGMPVGGAILEQMSDMDVALMELVNECYHMLTMGMCVISGFQLVMMCYLFLLGPLAAAFYAWPQVGRSLFRQAFSVWLDAVVILSLWKFWWQVTLVCMTVRLESGGVDPFNPFEVYYLIAFFAILLVMPFNPFDFHGSAIVGFIESKAAGVVGKVAQGGKSQGGKNSGKSGGKMAHR